VTEDPAPDQLHPSEHRAYRELYVGSRQLMSRWRRLGEALADTECGPVFDRGRARITQLVDALEPTTAAYGLYGGPAAQGMGARIGDVRGAVADRSVDTGMVARQAVLDIDRLATLLGQLAELAGARSDAKLAAFCREWEAAIRPEVDAARDAAVALGSDPDRVAAPLDDSALAQVAHGAGWVMGSVGEAVDRIAASHSRERDEERG
jgi:hypothetical protein